MSSGRLALWGALVLNAVVCLHTLRTLHEAKPQDAVPRAVEEEASSADSGTGGVSAADIAVLEKHLNKVEEEVAAGEAGFWSGEAYFRKLRPDTVDPQYEFNGECKWLGTSGLTPYGTLNGRNFGCQDAIQPDAAGICQCSDGTIWGKSRVSVNSAVFCSQVCQESPGFDSYHTLKSKYDRPAPNIRAAFVAASRSKQFMMLMRTLRSLTKAINRIYNYPIVLIHDPKDSYSETLRKEVVKATGPAKVHFLTATHKYFAVPRRVNATKVGLQRSKKGTPFLFRQMSRYMVGMFFKEHLFDNVDYVFKFEVGTLFLCEVPYDPFLLMVENNKTIGFSLMYHDNKQVMPTLGGTVNAYQRANKHNTSRDVLTTFVEEGVSYTGCSFGSSFVTLSMDYLRSEEHSEAFAALDKSDGFFYETWPFHPVLTLLASMTVPLDRWYYYESIAVATPVNGHHVPEDPYFCRNDPVPQRISAVCVNDTFDAHIHIHTHTLRVPTTFAIPVFNALPT